VVPVDVRVVGATRRTLDELAGARRSDRELWSDLKILEVTTPPLRDRRSDIALLVGHFLRQWARSAVDPCRVSRKAWRAITAYSYPGNVRELIHALQRARTLARGNEIDLDQLPPEMSSEKANAVAPLSEAAREFERAYLRRAVGTCNPAALAQRLGLSRATLRSKLRRHGIPDAGAERQGCEQEIAQGSKPWVIA
jgi:DNA-binding NtrC family response regulator